MLQEKSCIIRRILHIWQAMYAESVAKLVDVLVSMHVVAFCLGKKEMRSIEGHLS